MPLRLLAPSAALLTALAVLPATGRIEAAAPPPPMSEADVVTIEVPAEDLARCRATLAQVTGAPVEQTDAIAPVAATELPVARCVVE
ncbi:hypothetical protein E0K89_010945 [Aquicoccus sp. SCR17]|nr:hypothetical protein [Carideicomes alvinocaridis]